MNDWIPLEATAVRNYITAVQFDLLRKRGRNQQTPDPFETMREATVARIRSDVRAGRSTGVSRRLDTIPPETLGPASALIINDLRNRFPTMPVDEKQETRIAEAKRLLDLIRSGRLPVTPPSDPMPLPGALRCPVLRSRPPLRSNQLKSL